MANSIAVKEITSYLEEIAPKSLAENYDNVGLIVGEGNEIVSGILVTLDVTEAIIDEALAQRCNLIVAHHPIWFTARKQLNSQNFVGRCILRAIRNRIQLYAIHTNLDNILENGVSHKMASVLGLDNIEVLQPEKEQWLLVQIFFPKADLGAQIQQLFSSYSWAGLLELTESAGKWKVHKHKLADAYRILSAFPQELAKELVIVPQNGALRDNRAPGALSGFGAIGNFPEPIPVEHFFRRVKEAFRCATFRYANASICNIQKVAVCGGAGSFLIETALQAKADAFITGDITYHKFFDNENQMLLLDIGHYESEQYTADILAELLASKFGNKVKIYKTNINTNPISYYL
jgi:dinuclear metal center YbgI/SA1388 family protein